MTFSFGFFGLFCCQTTERKKQIRCQLYYLQQLFFFLDTAFAN
jgi:hypothetical protein